MTDIPVIYIAGKYSDGNYEGVERNIRKARRAAIELVELGFAPICPHLNHAHFEEDCKATYGQYLSGDFEILKRCDGVLLLDNWQDSIGAKKERLLAMERRMPIFESIEEAIAWKSERSKSS